MADEMYTPGQRSDAQQQMEKLRVDASKLKEVHANVMFAKLSELARFMAKPIIKWSRVNSLWPMQFGLACCAIELMDFGSSRIDAERKGYFLFRETPRQTDVMIVAGWVTKAIAPRLKRLYEQMAKPRYVIAYGECAVCGGPWWESYNIVQGIDQVLPVDVYVAGCPPRPENLFVALMKLQEKISGNIVGNTKRSISENFRRAEK
jgi:NADH-quinone oxidoreductase subunit B